MTSFEEAFFIGYSESQSLIFGPNPLEFQTKSVAHQCQELTTSLPTTSYRRTQDAKLATTISRSSQTHPTKASTQSLGVHKCTTKQVGGNVWQNTELKLLYHINHC